MQASPVRVRRLPRLSPRSASIPLSNSSILTGDFDHPDGNAWLHAAGAAILAHTNTKRRLSTTTRVEGWNFTFPPAPAEAIPADVFDEERTLKLNGTSIALKYYGPAHTDGDISVYLQTPMFSMSVTRTATIHSSIIQPAAASMA